MIVTMNSAFERPLVRWDDLHLVLSLPAVETLVGTRLSAVEAISQTDFDGRGDVLVVTLRVHWKGMQVRVLVEVREVRVRLRRLGFRLGRMRVAGGVPVPRVAVLRTLQRMLPELVTVVPRTAIVIVDLRRWIPPEVDVRVVAVQVSGEELHVWLASGSVDSFPLSVHRRLPAGEAAASLPDDGA